MIEQTTFAADCSRAMRSSDVLRTMAGVAWLTTALLGASPVAVSAQRSEGGREKPGTVRDGASAGYGPLRREFYDSPAGFVEVFGLRRWSLDELRDSVRAYRPGLDLHSAACQVVLRERFGFVDALVSIAVFLEDGVRTERRITLKLVEPGDSLRTRWNVTPAISRDSFVVLRPSYSALVLAVTDSAGNLYVGRLSSPVQFAALPPEVLDGEPARVRADAARLMAFLQAHRAEADREMALSAVRRDGFYANRLVAAMVLTNFPRHRPAWYATIAALRDPNEAVRSAARLSLRVLVASFSTGATPGEQAPADSIDWRPALADLRLLVGGTNVEASEDVFQALARTGVSAALARPLLHDNAEWLLLHLTSSDPSVRFTARSLLVRLAGGRDLGGDPAAWARWIATLSS